MRGYAHRTPLAHHSNPHPDTTTSSDARHLFVHSGHTSQRAFFGSSTAIPARPRTEHSHLSHPLSTGAYNQAETTTHRSLTCLPRQENAASTRRDRKTSSQMPCRYRTRPLRHLIKRQPVGQLIPEQPYFRDPDHHPTGDTTVHTGTNTRLPAAPSPRGPVRVAVVAIRPPSTSAALSFTSTRAGTERNPACPDRRRPEEMTSGEARGACDRSLADRGDGQVGTGRHRPR
jgi:hypothetical protein